MFDDFEKDLNASSFNKSKQINTTEQFNLLLTFIYKCYELMILDKVKVPANDENKIRDILLDDYLNNNEIRHQYSIDFIFNPEVPEQDGRCDIKVQTLNSFVDTKAYYLFECKRIDGKSNLNNSYVNDGIKRFTTKYKSTTYKEYYSSYYGVNAMIGFIIATINDIDLNMKKIAPKCITIKKNKFYKTNHNKLTLFHMMMDFSKHI